ncbi:MAG: hypothetical protein AAF399_14850 [Bacteroidota bacterium]
MKYLLPICFSLLGMYACKSSSSQALSRKQAKQLFFQDPGALNSKWQLIRIDDPYDGGKRILPEANNPHYLVFYQGGRFLDYDRFNYNDGIWLIHKDRKQMALVHEIENGRRIPAAQQDTVYRHHLIKTGDTLTLGRQGRHGVVTYTYLPVVHE